jgi:hypothetical protein
MSYIHFLAYAFYWAIIERILEDLDENLYFLITEFHLVKTAISARVCDCFAVFSYYYVMWMPPTPEINDQLANRFL